MRIGKRIAGAVASSIAAAVFAIVSMGAAAERVQPVPLGGSLADQAGDKSFGVYVPTKFGGVLSIKSSSGTVDALAGPDGRPRRNGDEVGRDQHGWYTFRVSGADKTYSVETTFVQVAKAGRMPWNFYYWPTKGDSIHEPWAGGNGRVDTMRNPSSDDVQVAPYGSYIAPGQDIILPGPNGLLETAVSPGDDSTWFPNLYDDMTFRGADGTWYQTPSPLLKFDQLFSVPARMTEAGIQNKDIQRWPGHCLGGAMASIMLNEPVPAPGSGLTQDELKALWAELGENHFNHQIGDNANNIPPGPPRPGWDPCDASVPRVHQMLETHIRGRGKALLGNLRAFPPNGKPNEVWNHGIGKYTAKYHAIAGKGERAVRIELELVANSGSNLNNSDNKPRINTYVYELVYGLNGMVDESAANMADWISVGGEAVYAPLNIMEVVQSKWQGHNPYVTEDRVRQIDMANGGGFGNRFAGGAPTFRPVGQYEGGYAGGGRMGFFAFGNRGGGGEEGFGADSPSPRRGFLRMFGR
jgi:hypothetical protein